jgi:hypothetical protein
MPSSFMLPPRVDWRSLHDEAGNLRDFPAQGFGKRACGWRLPDGMAEK